MAAASAVALGGIAGAGLVGGAIAGYQGTPDQRTYQDQYLEVGDASAEEKRLQSAAIDEYFKQLQGIDAQDQSLGRFEQLQQGALRGYGDILSGAAFNPTQQELGLINAQRDAAIQSGTSDINRLLSQATAQTNDNAALRGLRGQASAELHGANIRSAGDQVGRLVNQATMQSLQAQRDAPLQRLGIQSPLLQQGVNMAEELRQRAIQNRALSQNPAILNSLTQQRFQQGVTHSEGLTPGQKGGWMGALSGGLAGVSGGLGAGAAGMNAVSNMQMASNLRASGAGAGGSTTVGGFGSGGVGSTIV